MSATRFYVGGEFTSIDGEPRFGLAAVDAVDGRVQTWAPQPNAPVVAFAEAAGRLYTGGGFTRVGTVGRMRLAAFDLATGELTPWNPGVAREPTDPVGVSTLVIDRGTLYVGGLFTEIAGQQRRGIAAVDLASGTLTAWNPGDDESGDVEAIAVAGETVYAGGTFESMGGSERTSLAAVDARTGRALAWRADVTAYGDPGEVHSLVVAGGHVYVGGLYNRLGGRPRSHLAQVDAITGVPAGWDPRPADEVWSLAAADEGVLVGGSFSGLDSQSRENVMAVDLGTGALLPFRAPPIEYPAVSSLATQGDGLFVGGGSTASAAVAAAHWPSWTRAPEQSERGLHNSARARTPPRSLHAVAGCTSGATSPASADAGGATSRRSTRAPGVPRAGEPIPTARSAPSPSPTTLCMSPAPSPASAGFVAVTRPRSTCTPAVSPSGTRRRMGC